MISIITSVYRTDIFENFKRSLKDTIGVTHEVVSIENFEGKMGLCEVYNRGAAQSKFPYLCFVHEDVIFRTVNWGNKIIAVYDRTKNIGLIGIAGSKYKSLAPSAWFNYGFENLDFRYLIQHFPSGNETQYQNTLPSLDDTLVEVVTLDGVFLFTSRNIWNENKFDDLSLKGFHCYDIDFSLQVGLKNKNFVTNLILIEHLSLGSLNRQWIEQTIKLSKKWRYYLPKGNITDITQRSVELTNRAIFINLMISYDFSFPMLYKVLLANSSLKYFSLKNSIKLFITILSKGIRKLIVNNRILRNLKQ